MPHTTYMHDAKHAIIKIYHAYNIKIVLDLRIIESKTANKPTLIR
jgi:hypothetical protein